MSDLFRAMETVLEMVADRGYIIFEAVKALMEKEKLFWADKAKGIAVEETKGVPVIESTTPISDLMRTRPIVFHSKPAPEKGDKQDFIIVSFLSRGQNTQVGKTATDPFMKEIFQKSYKEAIAIVDGPLSTDSKDIIEKAMSQVLIQVFTVNELLFNVTKHVMVPKHEKIPDSQVPDLLRELKVTKSNLPGILYEDPVVRYYNWPPGSIIQVTRDIHYLEIPASIAIQYRVVKPPKK